MRARTAMAAAVGLAFLVGSALPAPAARWKPPKHGTTTTSTTTAPTTSTTAAPTTSTTAAPTTSTTAAPTTTTTAATPVTAPSTTTTAPPSTSPACTKVLSGAVSLAGFTVPATETWCFDAGVTTTVQSTANVIVQGNLVMRPSSASVVHTLRFVGINEANYVGGGGTPLASDVGLWVTGAGRLDVAGTPKTAWVRASGGIAAGATTLSLNAAPVNWAPGDEILITPTASPALQYHYAMEDSAAIQSRPSATSVTLSKATQFAHPSVAVSPTKTMTAEVANLTRNVQIDGTATGRAHVWIKSSRPQALYNVAIRHMGPRKNTGETDAYGPITDLVKGRYGLHLHDSLDGSRGTVVEGAVMRDTGAHGYVPHNSHGITLRSSIGYNIIGDGFWWDDLDTTAPDFDPRFPQPQVTHDLLVENNLIGRIRTIPEYRGVQAAAFLLGSGDRNVMRGNVAFGVQGTVNSSGYKWRESDGMAGIWTFEDNVSHNNKIEGIWIWQVAPAIHVVSRLTAYHNGNTGIFSGAYANNYQFYDSVLYGNGGQINGTQFLAWAPSFGSGSQVVIQGLRMDAAGLTPHALKLSGRTPAALETPQPGLVAGNVFRNYTQSAVKVTYDFHDFGPYSTQWLLTGNDYGTGVPFYFSNDIHEATAVTVQDLGSPFVLRRADQAGTLVTAWNARKS